jgi:tol-pal system protein YbgF
LSTRVARLRSDLTSSVETIDKQLIAIEELTGQSQRKLQELRATLDARTTAPANPTDTPAGTTPGPNQLLDLAQSQMAAGSNATARTALQDLLTNYPTADVAPDALYYIADTYAAEGNTASADSVYALVVTRYPDSPHAATALYKRGVAAQTAGRSSQARALFNEIIRKYPQSPEAPLAKDRLNNRR